MKKISKKDSERILNYLSKARKILDGYEEYGDDIEICNTELAYDCLSKIDVISIALNNAII